MIHEGIQHVLIAVLSSNNNRLKTTGLRIFIKGFKLKYSNLRDSYLCRISTEKCVHSLIEAAIWIRRASSSYFSNNLKLVLGCWTTPERWKWRCTIRYWKCWIVKIKNRVRRSCTRPFSTIIYTCPFKRGVSKVSNCILIDIYELRVLEVMRGEVIWSEWVKTNSGLSCCTGGGSLEIAKGQIRKNNL